MKIKHKHCRRCEVKLIPHTNISPSRYRAKGWICNKCHNQKTTDDRDKVHTCRGCKTELRFGDISTQKWNSYDYVCKPCAKKERYKAFYNHHPTIKYHFAGIYCWKLDGDIVYIGESQVIHERYSQHRARTSTTSLRCESLYNKPIKELTFEVMCEVEDKRERLIREYELIAQHKPPLNFPYWDS